MDSLQPCPRIIPISDTGITNIKKQYDALYEEFYRKYEDLRNKMVNLSFERERAVKALQKSTNAQLTGTSVLYWMRSRSKYVPAVITGVHQMDIEGQGEIYVEVQVKGTVRKIHINDICYEETSYEL